MNVFKRLGINDVLGIDGPWVNKELLYQHIDPEEFKDFDLEKEIKLDKKYDLVLSLEVAEHLKKDSADVFVQNIINSGNVILFSAAIPNQGGQNHINEQWLTYWEEKFVKHNYVIHDIIRPMFWDHSELLKCYKQNMVLIASEDFKLKKTEKVVPMRNIVHPEMYQQRAMQRHEALSRLGETQRRLQEAHRRLNEIQRRIDEAHKRIAEDQRRIDEIRRGEIKTTIYIKLLLYSLFGYDFIQKIKLLLSYKKH